MVCAVRLLGIFGFWVIPLFIYWLPWNPVNPIRKDCLQSARWQGVAFGLLIVIGVISYGFDLYFLAYLALLWPVATVVYSVIPFLATARGGFQSWPETKLIVAARDAPDAKQLHRWQLLAAFLAYLVLSLLWVASPLMVHGRGYVIGIGNRDTTSFLWYLRWWPYAILHGLDPFHMTKIWYPGGINAAWISSIPAIAILLAPVTLTFGATAAFNTAIIASPVLAALATFGLAREWGSRFIPALVGGFVFGFSIYEMMEAHRDVNLAVIFQVPALLWVFAARKRGRMGRSLFISLTTWLWIFNFGVFTETFATSVVVGFFLMANTLLLFSKEKALESLRRTMVEEAIAFFAAVVCVLSVFLIPLWQGGVSTPAWPKGANSLDITSVAPVSAYAFLTRSMGEVLRTHIYASLPSSDLLGYLGVPAVLVMAVAFYRMRNTLFGRVSFLMFSIGLIFSMGPTFKVFGHNLPVALPWSLFERLPILGMALPFRLFIYPLLAAALVIAKYLSEIDRRIAIPVAAVVVAFAAPNVPLPASHFYEPGFLRSGQYKKYIKRNSVVLFIPFSTRSPTMVWQERCHFWYRTVNGFTGLEPTHFHLSDHLLQFLLLTPHTKPPTRELQKFLAQHRVQYIVVTKQLPSQFARVFSAVAVRKGVFGGTTLFECPGAKRLLK